MFLKVSSVILINKLRHKLIKNSAVLRDLFFVLIEEIRGVSLSNIRLSVCSQFLTLNITKPWLATFYPYL